MISLPLELRILRDPGYGVGERVEVEVSPVGGVVPGVVQPDLIWVWGGTRGGDAAARSRGGWGGDGFGGGRAGFGFGILEPLGGGVFGFRGLAAGSAVIEHRTVGRFAAGDYRVRVRGVDAAGNVGPWAPPEGFVVRHRVGPGGVRGVSLVGSEIRFGHAG